VTCSWRNKYVSRGEETMTPDTSIIAKLLHVNGMHIEKVEVQGDYRIKDGSPWIYEKIVVHARPFERLRGICPLCGRHCPGYDTKGKEESTWRGPNLNGMLVEVKYQPKRIECSEHGVVTERIPWQDGASRFLPDFNNEVAFLALTCPKTVVTEFMTINWRTVGNCIQATHNRLEPDPMQRLHGLRRFCVDETSYEKGHSYITVIYDMDRNRVVWLKKGFGVEVFSEFCELLSEEDRRSIAVVAGDGAKWIDTCVKKYFPNAKRCIDFFHVISWVNDALDQTRRDLARKAQHEYERTKDRIDREIQDRKRAEQTAREGYINAQRELRVLKARRGRPSKRRLELEAQIEAYEEEFNGAEPLSGERGRRGKYTGEQLSMLDALEQNTSQIKGVKYALTMNCEDIQEQHQSRIDLIAASYPDLYQAYQLKERLRIILHLKDPYLAEEELRKWINDARNSGLKYFIPLADKIERHIANIMRSIECHANSAKSEATNTTIKALIKTARGFRNLDNMFALIMLRCSDIVIPLNNRYRPDAELQVRKRELANQRKADRENAKREAHGFKYSPTQGT